MSAWYALGGGLNQSFHYRALTNYIVALARIKGFAVPFPSHLDPGNFEPVAAAIAAAKKRGQRCVVPAAATIGVRIAEAAVLKGLDISGSLFVMSGESVTPAKRKYLEAAGLEVQIMYWITEVGPIGWSCSQNPGDDSIHLMRDSLAVISHEHPDQLAGRVVRPLLFTTLLPTAANLLINADMGDCASVTRADCSCAYSELGLNEKLSGIWSYAKLTGQGMTLAGTDIVELLETRLPARFGGLPGDYQLVEEERPGGTRLSLRIHPRVDVQSTEAVREAFLKELRGYYGGSLASRVWEHTDAVEVVVAPLIMTSTGKTPILHLLKPSAPESKG